MKPIFLSPYERQSIATISSRPIRIAFLIPIADIDMFLHSIRINCSLWNGAANILLPYEDIIAKNAFWVEILRNFRPDTLVVPDQAPESEIQWLLQEFDLFSVRRLSSSSERGLFNPLHFGIHIYSILRKLQHHLTKTSRLNISHFELTPDEHKKDLRYATTFGSINEDKSTSAFHPFILNQLSMDFFEVFLELRSPEVGSPPSYMRYFIDWQKARRICLFDLTLITGDRFSRSAQLDINQNLRKAPLVILGRGELSHYMLASALRDGVLWGLTHFPFLLDLTRDGLQEELRLMSHFLHEINAPFCTAFSLSVPTEDMNILSATLGIECRPLDKPQFLSLLQVRNNCCHESKEQYVLNKHMTIQLRRPELFHTLEPIDSYACELTFDNYRLPYRKTLNKEALSDKRLFAEGFTVFTSGNQDQDVYLTLPTVDDFLHSHPPSQKKHHGKGYRCQKESESSELIF